MTTPAATPAPPLPAVRVVFFGPPRSGKSALVGAVARRASAGAETPPVDLSPAAAHNPVRGELIPHRLLVDLPGPRSRTGYALLLDCDGRAAVELLTQPDRIRRATARGALAEAVRAADALVLVLDARDTAAEVEAQYRQFDTFLDALEAARADDREVGGLPVFLTLTKCDELHRHTDEPSDWLNRIELRKAEVRRQFNAHFADPDGDEPTDDPPPSPGFLTFGSMDVRSHATALRPPPGRGFDAYFRVDDATFGVDELLTELIAAAGGHRERAARSRTRLGWTIAGAVGLLAIMAAVLLGSLWLGEPGPVQKLERRLATQQLREGSVADRLADDKLDTNERAYAAIRDAEAFEFLPEHERAQVNDRLAEFTAYREYRDRFRPPQFSAADVRTSTDAEGVAADLAGRLKPPAAYADTWASTEAVELWKKWTADLALLQKAEDEIYQRYFAKIAAARQLMALDVPTAPWRKRATAELADPAVPAETDAVPGSATVRLRRGEPLTYAAVYRFERTANAAREWRRVRDKLTDLRDLSDALGLTADPEAKLLPGEPPALLDLPEPTDPASSLLLGTDRLEKLLARYPRVRAGVADWSSVNFPAPVRDELGRRLRLAAARGVRSVRGLVADGLKLPDGTADAPADWAKLAPTAGGGLLRTKPLQDWGRLLRLLLNWADPSRTDVDPVADLAEFLTRERFEWKIDALEVTVPDSLRVQVLTPGDALTVTVTPPGGAVRVTAFTRTGEARTDAAASTYTFALALTAGPLAYTPGEAFAAELPLTAGDAKFTLRWTQRKTNTYQFEALAREPVLDSPQGAQPATGVRARVLPAAAAVKVPELLPPIRQ